MSKSIADLNEKLFDQIDLLNDDQLTDEQLEKQSKKAKPWLKLLM